MKNYRVWLIVLFVNFLWSCDDDNEVEVREEVPVTLTNWTYISSHTAGALKGVIAISGIALPTDQMIYDVDFYKVEYKTLYKGNEITASGVVMIPDTEADLGTLSFQHGTITSNAEAPSQLSSTNLQLVLYQAVASAGMVTVVPDFIGFGASVDIMHPYYIEDLTATAVIDNIYAAKNLADELGRKVSNRLYLAGYSQGGYATMATHKHVEEKGIEGFELKASFASSGGYDIIGVREYFFDQEVYHQPVFLAYVAQAYKVTLDVTTALSDFFNEPYASTIPGLFDGSLSGTQINQMLNDTISVLVNADYLNDAGTDDRFESINNAFIENSLLDWTPEIPLFMYHGEADITVPYQNSVDTYNQLISNGASESVVTFTSLPGATHGTGVVPYIERFSSKLMEIEKP